VMALRVSRVHEGLFHSYNLFLFATPYTAYSILLSGCMSSPSLSTRESVRAKQAYTNLVKKRRSKTKGTSQ
jgi:hypothetical protein